MDQLFQSTSFIHNNRESPSSNSFIHRSSSNHTPRISNCETSSRLETTLQKRRDFSISHLNIAHSLGSSRLQTNESPSYDITLDDEEFDIDSQAARSMFFSLSQGEQTMKISDLEKKLFETGEFSSPMEKEALQTFIANICELRHLIPNRFRAPVNEELLKEASPIRSQVKRGRLSLILSSLTSLPFLNRIFQGAFNFSNDQNSKLHHQSRKILNIPGITCSDEYPNNSPLRDEDGDDIIHVNEFEYFMTQGTTINNSQLEMMDAFQIFDINNMEEISVELLKEIYSGWGTFSINDDAANVIEKFKLYDDITTSSSKEKQIDYRRMVSILVPEKVDDIFLNSALLPSWGLLELLTSKIPRDSVCESSQFPIN